MDAPANQTKAGQVEVKTFLADQVEAAQIGRDLAKDDNKATTIRLDALHAALRHAELAITTDEAAVIKTAKKFEKYLKGDDL